MFSRLPQLNQIKGFEAAARLGSFKAAAGELNITPTAISHQISNLEDRLGVLLFERKVRSIVLTQEGARFALVAHQALQQISTAIEEISDAQSVLNIATTTSFASMWLVPNLARFYKEHPDIQVAIRTGEELADIRRDRRIDLAIRYGRDVEKNTTAVKLVTERFAGYATEGYLNSCKDLTDATYIETRWKNKDLPSISWEKWLQTFNANISAPKISYFDQEDHVVQAALTGQGIALVSSVLAKMAVQNGWLKTMDDDCSLPGLTYYLLVSPFSANLRKVTVFRDWLIKELSEYA